MTDTEDNPHAKVGLEHWRVLAAVVDAGSYADAAEALGKSQSTVSYSIQRLEQLLGTRVLKIQGRKAVLTEVGKVALRRARVLLDEAADIERVARTLAAGVEAAVNLAVDTIFPNQILLPAFRDFAEEFPDTRIELYETVISGVAEMLLKGQVQLAVTPMVPQGWLGERLIELEVCCVAHPGHALHQLKRPLNEADLSRHRQLVVRESSEHRSHDSGWLGSEQRLTVSTMSTRIQALCEGLGFAWSPVLKIGRELEMGLLKRLPLERGSRRVVNLYLVAAGERSVGPATRAMMDHVKAQVALACEQR